MIFTKEKMYIVRYKGQLAMAQYELTYDDGFICMFVYGIDDYVAMPGDTSNQEITI